MLTGLGSMRQTIFSKEDVVYLNAMGIDPEMFETSLVKEFSGNAFLFHKLMQTFRKTPANAIKTELFNDFLKSFQCPADGIVCDKLFDFFNYIRLFNDGGILSLYKGRQAEWNGPKVKIKRADVPGSDIHHLANNELIYRGMSVEELQSGDFGQSWTIDASVARRFASETYSDKPAGIVVMTKLNLPDAIYHSKTDPECEVIVACGSIHFNDVLKF